MKRVGVVRVRELLGCLIVAAFTMNYTQVQLHHRAAAAAAAASAAFAAPGIAATTPFSFTKRVDLLPMNASAKFKLSIADILHTENHRIAFIKAKLLQADGAAAYDPMQFSTQTPLYSGQIVDFVNYIFQVGLGTPAQNLYLAIDTGSDLAWTQCQPCNICYMQKDPIFDPSESFSYQQIPCESPQCAQLGSQSGNCSSTNAFNCDYRIPYLDGSSTIGDFALEILTVDDIIASVAYPFGCGHQNQGLFKGYDGIIGFSRDSLAFPAQTKDLFGEIFSYCMPPIFSSSAGYIEFGASSGDGASTPLSKSTFYVVEIESVQVEGASSMSQPATSKEMVVDSGTVLTRLDRPLYEQVRNAFKEGASSIMEAPEGAGMGLFDTCYIADNTSQFPQITFTFMGGLTLTLTTQNSIFPIDNNGTVCLALLASDLGFSILGNYQQQGHLFTFDIPQSTLSISSEAC